MRKYTFRESSKRSSIPFKSFGSFTSSSVICLLSWICVCRAICAGLNSLPLSPDCEDARRESFRLCSGSALRHCLTFLRASYATPVIAISSPLTESHPLISTGWPLTRIWILTTAFPLVCSKCAGAYIRSMMLCVPREGPASTTSHKADTAPRTTLTWTELSCSHLPTSAEHCCHVPVRPAVAIRIASGSEQPMLSVLAVLQPQAPIPLS